MLLRDGLYVRFFTIFLTISKKLNVSESTIRKRVKKLENNEIIKKYTITINPKKLGYHSISLLGLDVSPHNYLEAANKLSKFPEIIKMIKKDIK